MADILCLSPGQLQQVRLHPRVHHDNDPAQPEPDLLPLDLLLVGRVEVLLAFKSGTRS